MKYNAKSSKAEEFINNEEIMATLEWVDEMMEKSQYSVDPLWTVMKEGGPAHTKSGPVLGQHSGTPYCRNGALPQYLERLENTGRAKQAQLLRAKYAAQ